MTTAAWPPMSAGCSSTCPVRRANAGGPPQPELVLRVIEHPAGRIVVTMGTHDVPFGLKNVPHHAGGEQAHGEEPGQQGGEVPSGADALIAGHLIALAGEDEDEVAPDGEEVDDLGEG